MEEEKTLEAASEIVDAVNADALLEEIQSCEETIRAAELERDAFISRYKAKICAATELCERKTQEARESIALITEELRRYAVTQITDKKRSVNLPSGTLQFRRQEPKFFFDDLSEANAKDERLIHFVKHNAYSYLKVKVDESVDWTKFKRQLIVDDEGGVSYKETGEIIDGLHAQFLPDKFSVKLNAEAKS